MQAAWVRKHLWWLDTLAAADHKGFHQKRNSAVAFRPGNVQFLDCSIAVFELGYTRLDDGFKLAGIQMPPPSLSPTVNVSSLGAVRWIRHTWLRLRTTSTTTRWSVKERSTDFTDQGVFSPRRDVRKGQCLSWWRRCGLRSRILQ